MSSSDLNVESVLIYSLVILTGSYGSTDFDDTILLICNSSFESKLSIYFCSIVYKLKLLLETLETLD